jgi:hypothetical protein
MKLLRHPGGIPLTAMAYNTFGVVTRVAAWLGSPPATRCPSVCEKVSTSREIRSLKADTKEAKGGSFVTKNGEIFEYRLSESYNTGHRNLE